MTNRNDKILTTGIANLQMQIGSDQLVVPPMRQLTPRTDSLEGSRVQDEARIAALETGQTVQDAALTGEQIARANGDSVGASALQAEQVARIAGDAALNAETAHRVQADSTEKTARTTADANLQAQIDAIKAKVTKNKRGIVVPASALGLLVSVVCTWDTPFADANYNIIPVLQGSTALLANVSVKGYTARTAASCTILLRADGILSLGATLDVTGIHD